MQERVKMVPHLKVIYDRIQSLISRPINEIVQEGVIQIWRRREHDVPGEIRFLSCCMNMFRNIGPDIRRNFLVGNLRLLSRSIRRSRVTSNDTKLLTR